MNPVRLVDVLVGIVAATIAFFLSGLGFYDFGPKWLALFWWIIGFLNIGFRIYDIRERRYLQKEHVSLIRQLTRGEN